MTFASLRPLNSNVISHMLIKTANRKAIAWWVFLSSLVAAANIVTFYYLFGLAYQLDYTGAPEWQLNLFSFVFYVVAPIPILLGYIDSNIVRFTDVWYYIGVVVNAILWGNAVLFFSLKNAKIKSLYNRLVQ